MLISNHACCRTTQIFEQSADGTNAAISCDGGKNAATPFHHMLLHAAGCEPAAVLTYGSCEHK